ncbi:MULTISPECIES: hypothetical protein [unclassified Paenibacillus]|uniref:hypothetical protein n=1 Tax=unclassified Paenibacillus TaxID=185978 RepID=UPI0017886538|nr:MULTISPECIES: hypothetical protein [unclassified Paenibacillus]QOT12910.1 hypothetical protein JNUCC32_13170 [Paenibacillus sp. JNUCC-32]WFB61056.1 hypothetical protein P0X86_12960 [Paenibacillus sp. BR1-192]
MSNSVSKWFAAFLALLLLYLVPAGEMARRQDDLSRLIVYQSVTKFVDSVRTKGYITPTMYNDFLQELAATGNIYNVEMEHHHKKYHPEYADPSDPGSFLNRYSVVYDAYYQDDLMGYLFPDSNLDKSDDSRRYRLTAGDHFQVSVTSLNRTPGLVIFDTLTGSNSEGTAAIAFPYGGLVLNEDY